MSVPTDQLAAILPGDQPSGTGAPLDETRVPSRWGVVFSRFRSRRLAVAGLVTLGALFALAFLGPYLTHWKHTDLDFSAFLQPPSGKHWFGTTQTGADVYA